jgi:hypothetical protein
MYCWPISRASRNRPGSSQDCDDTSTARTVMVTRREMCEYLEAPFKRSFQCTHQAIRTSASADAADQRATMVRYSVSSAPVYSVSTNARGATSACAGGSNDLPHLPPGSRRGEVQGQSVQTLRPRYGLQPLRSSDGLAFALPRRGGESEGETECRFPHKEGGQFYRLVLPEARMVGQAAEVCMVRLGPKYRRASRGLFAAARPALAMPVMPRSLASVEAP